MNVSVKALTPDRWDDLLTLFGPNGACWGCWCMYWRYTDKKFKHTTTKERKIALELITNEESYPPGLIAYNGVIPIGWIPFSPRKTFKRLVK